MVVELNHMNLSSGEAAFNTASRAQDKLAQVQKDLSQVGKPYERHKLLMDLDVFYDRNDDLLDTESAAILQFQAGYYMNHDVILPKIQNYYRSFENIRELNEIDTISAEALSYLLLDRVKDALKLAGEEMKMPGDSCTNLRTMAPAVIWMLNQFASTKDKNDWSELYARAGALELKDGDPLLVNMDCESGLSETDINTLENLLDYALPLYQAAVDLGHTDLDADLSKLQKLSAHSPDPNHTVLIDKMKAAHQSRQIVQIAPECDLF